MRYAPAAVALSLLVAVTSSVSFGATHEPDPRAVALAAEGRAQLQAGQIDEAMTSFEAALAVDPQHVAVYHQLAEAARKQGMQGKAIHYYREALEGDPVNVYAISGEGLALVEKGAVDRARRNLARLEQICGDGCAPAKALAAAIQQGPAPQMVSAEAVQAKPVVTTN